MALPYGRKWRGTKKPLDESERGERKSWLKAQHSENEDHGIRSHHFMGNRLGKQWKQCQTLFWGAPKSLQMVTAPMKLNDAYLEKEMATDSSTLAWKIPWTEEPDRLQSMRSQRVRHDWVTSLSQPENILCIVSVLLNLKKLVIIFYFISYAFSVISKKSQPNPKP